MSKLFDKALDSVHEDVKRFVDNSMDVVDQIHHIITAKGISQRDLAALMEKKESEISKWMKGTHNFTFRTISKLEAVLGESLIITPLKAKELYTQIKFVKVKTFARPNDQYRSSGARFIKAKQEPLGVQIKNYKAAS